MEYVRRLLGQKQPAFAASLELAAARLERQLREPGMAPPDRQPQTGHYVATDVRE